MSLAKRLAGPLFYCYNKLSIKIRKHLFDLFLLSYTQTTNRVHVCGSSVQIC